MGAGPGALSMLWAGGRRGPGAPGEWAGRAAPVHPQAVGRGAPHSLTQGVCEGRVGSPRDGLGQRGPQRCLRGRGRAPRPWVVLLFSGFDPGDLSLMGWGAAPEWLTRALGLAGSRDKLGLGVPPWHLVTGLCTTVNHHPVTGLDCTNNPQPCRALTLTSPSRNVRTDAP